MTMVTQDNLGDHARLPRCNLRFLWYNAFRRQVQKGHLCLRALSGPSPANQLAWTEENNA